MHAVRSPFVIDVTYERSRPAVARGRASGSGARPAAFTGSSAL
jgi:hypothetical protein